MAAEKNFRNFIPLKHAFIKLYFIFINTLELDKPIKDC